MYPCYCIIFLLSRQYRCWPAIIFHLLPSSSSVSGLNVLIHWIISSQSLHSNLQMLLFGSGYKVISIVVSKCLLCPTVNKNYVLWQQPGTEYEKYKNAGNRIHNANRLHCRWPIIIYNMYVDMFNTFFPSGLFFFYWVWSIDDLPVFIVLLFWMARTCGRFSNVLDEMCGMIGC